MENNNLTIITQQQEAINYTEKIIEQKKEQGEFGVQSFWQEAILNFLKNQALIFVGQALTHLKKQAIGWAVDLAHWLLSNLEDYLVQVYQRASEEEKAIFLKKIY